MDAFLAVFWAVVLTLTAASLLAIPVEAAIHNRRHRSPKEG